MVIKVPLSNTDHTGYSLGPLVARWMESHLVFGPGDLRGRPYKLDAEKRALLNRIYEVEPPGKTTQEGKLIEGRRRFKRCAISVRKGSAKTEFAAAIAAAELHPEAPVRFREWHRVKGGKLVPLGRGVLDPYIPMVAYTEEQSEELAYGALKSMLEEGDLAHQFSIGWERILVIGPSGAPVGKAVALAAAPESRDGARTTFQVFDETHRMQLEKLVQAHQTMLNNIPKRWDADAWTLEITTSYEPGMNSVAEATMEYALAVKDGRVKNSRLFFFHRQANDGHKLWTEKGDPEPASLRQAVIEASGEAIVPWSDIDGIVDLAMDPQVEKAKWERLWLNRPVQSQGQAFPMGRIDELAHSGWTPPTSSLVTLGFDGAQTRDTTALVLTHVESGRQSLLACWKNPGMSDDWKVPADEVDQTVEAAFKIWDVWRLYADPYYWDTHVAEWTAKYMHKRGPERGKARVFAWATNVHKRMALSLKAYLAGMNEGVWSYDGHPDFRAHLANARRYPIPILDEDEANLFLIRKERPDSPRKIDIAMAGCLSWEAYRDCIAAGANVRKASRVPVSI